MVVGALANRDGALSYGRQPATIVRMITALRILCLALLTCLAACAVPPGAPSLPALDLESPPIVVFGSDTTYPDGRTLVDPRFAAAFITANGEWRLFDDIGRMVLQRAVAGQEIAATWVHDYESDLWLPAESAYFVASINLVTPRGSGLLAVHSPERADQLARELSGEVLALTAVPAYLAAGAADPLPQPSGGLELGGLLEADGK